MERPKVPGLSVGAAGALVLTLLLVGCASPVTKPMITLTTHDKSFLNCAANVAETESESVDAVNGKPIDNAQAESAAVDDLKACPLPDSPKVKQLRELSLSAYQHGVQAFYASDEGDLSKASREFKTSADLTKKVQDILNELPSW